MTHKVTTTAELDDVLASAAQAGRGFGDLPATRRADMLRDLAAALDAERDALIGIAESESHLPRARLVGEFARTTGQLRFLAEVILDGAWLRATIDTADPSEPLLQPDIRSWHEPIGVALVFAAGNFPFAFSVAGGDTASALATGCPVVLKAHPGHPELSTRVGAVVKQSFGDAFALITGVDAGRAAIVDKRVRAAAFTGSVTGGRALFDLATRRTDPIPFYGELGSINPVFVTAKALAARGDDIADGYVTSFTLATGQMCTKPGLLFAPAGHGLGPRIASRAAEVAAAEMLEERIAAGHARRRAELRATTGVRVLGNESSDPTRPEVLTTTTREMLGTPDLLDECFGPTSIIVEYEDPSDLLDAARRIEGSLTATIHAEPEDGALVDRLVAELRTRVGRVVYNGWPTGVRVTWAMQHGGPWPATTSPLHTSVGAAAIDRFIRPLAFQNTPQANLPAALRDRNELGIVRRVNGTSTTDDVPSGGVR